MTAILSPQAVLFLNHLGSEAHRRDVIVELLAIPAEELASYVHDSCHEAMMAIPPPVRPEDVEAHLDGLHQVLYHLDLNKDKAPEYAKQIQTIIDRYHTFQKVYEERPIDTPPGPVVYSGNGYRVEEATLADGSAACLLTRDSLIGGTTATEKIPEHAEVIVAFLNADRQSRPLIQDAFPNCTSTQREFILTGITDDQWSRTMGDDEETGNE